jgi:hypothetical protein
VVVKLLSDRVCDPGGGRYACECKASEVREG